MQDFYLFEVSFELICSGSVVSNMLRAKLSSAAASQSGRYMLIGAWNERDAQNFNEEVDDFWQPIVLRLSEHNLKGHTGYWQQDTVKVPVLLLEQEERLDYDELLYQLWRDFKIDSLLSGEEYRRAVIFGFGAGQAIQLVTEAINLSSTKILASFHEWESGVGLFYLRKYMPTVSTSFILHSTALGLALAERHQTFHDLNKDIDAETLAHSCGVFARHCMERQLALESDALSAVGGLVAQEANYYLGRFPDRILASGCELQQLDALSDESRQSKREQFLQAIGVPLEQVAGCVLLLSSGHSDSYNQGYESLLEAVVRLKDKLPYGVSRVVLCLAVMHPPRDAHFKDQGSEATDSVSPLNNYSNQQEIAQLLDRLQLDSAVSRDAAIGVEIWQQNKEYADAGNFSYHQLLNIADWAIFPLQYAAWGYSAQESWTLGTPTITTNLSGFGGWCEERLTLRQRVGLQVLDFRGVSASEQVTLLASRMSELLQLWVVGDRYQVLRSEAKGCAQVLAWCRVYQVYQESYQLAFKLHSLAQLADVIKTEDSDEVTALSNEMSAVPRLYEARYESVIPTQLSGLRMLAGNLWWSWHEPAKRLFARLDPELWRRTRNPIILFNSLSYQQWQRAVADPELMREYQRVLTDFQAYLAGSPGANCDSDGGNGVKRCSSVLNGKIAYFCMEYGLDNNLPCYSGGLGVLAADYLKSMSDLGVDCVAVGLLYRRGYFLQRINAKGQQEEDYPELNLAELPLSLVRDQHGRHLLTSVEIAGRTVYAQVWKFAVGRVDLYLLDTDVDENLVADRTISGNLYVSGTDARLMQELLLGIGGVRFLQEQLGLLPVVYHLNEGHSAFLVLERLRYFTHVKGYSVEEAVPLVRSTTQFTTHTPVAVGNEQFSWDLVRSYLGSYLESRLRINADQLLEWGRASSDDKTVFSLTVLALRFSLQINTVSELHNQVSKRLWHDLWKNWLVSEVPFVNINNGVHLATWLGPEMRALYDEVLPAGWDTVKQDWQHWQTFLHRPLEDFAKAHFKQKQRLLDEVKRRIVDEYLAREENPRLLEQSLTALRQKNSLVIGISRRFAAYKRNNLFMLLLKRLGRLLTDVRRPVLILMAGKAHPADQQGKEMLQQALRRLREPELAGRVIFLQNYDIELAKLLVQGVDLWLNTPVTGSEACGTSGMKVAINGGLNLSTRDGWWNEVADRNWGWSIDNYQNSIEEDRRAKLENSLLIQLLEREIIPTFYDSKLDNPEDPWLIRVRESLVGVGYHYNAVRMALSYMASYSQLTAYNRKLLLGSGDSSRLHSLINWQRELESRFNRVSVKAAMVKGIKNGRVLEGGRLQVKVLLYPGKMSAGELVVELVLLASGREWSPILVTLHRVENKGQDEEFQTYVAEYQLQDSGFYHYGIRIMPTMPLLFRAQEARVVRWS